jgi:hypothetical protein
LIQHRVNEDPSKNVYLLTSDRYKSSIDRLKSEDAQTPAKKIPLSAPTHAGGSKLGVAAIDLSGMDPAQEVRLQTFSDSQNKSSPGPHDKHGI